MIYTDVLGRLDPVGTVSTILPHGKTDWLLTTLSNAPEMRWSWDIPLETILVDLDQAGWDTMVTYPHYGCPPHIQVTHRATIAAQEASKIFLAGNGDPGYVRYGDCPKSGHSINHVTGDPEKGVSVYDAIFFKNGYQVSTPHYSTGTYISVCAQNRKIYRVWGNVVGHGSDGEPILQVTKSEQIG